MITFAVFFLMAALADATTMRWHRAREGGRIAQTALLSMILESLSWIPVWVALSADRVDIMIASIVGSGIGTAAGMRKVAARALPEK